MQPGQVLHTDAKAGVRFTHTRFCILGGTPLQNALKPLFQDAQQFSGLDGLGDVVIHAAGQAAVFFVFHGVGRDRDNREIRRGRVLPDDPGRLHAVHNRHLKIHEHQIHGFVFQKLHGFPAVFGRQQFQAGGGEELLQQKPVDLVVFRDQGAFAAQIQGFQAFMF